VLEDLGGHAEIRLAPDLPARSRRRTRSHLTLVASGTPVWDSETLRYIRRIVIDFDIPVLAASLADTSDFQILFAPRLMFSNAHVGALAELLADECASAHPNNQRYGDGLALAIFHNLFRVDEVARSSPKSGLTPRQLRRATEHMERCLPRSVDLKDLAEMIGYSQSYFSRAFKTSTGVPPQRWQLTARIQRAQEILIQTGDPLAEVAAAYGFADQSHFTRAFQHIAGETPGAWRRNHDSVDRWALRQFCRHHHPRPRRR
jgi:AraC family transcriptional regulator